MALDKGQTFNQQNSYVWAKANLAVETLEWQVVGQIGLVAE